MVERRKYRQWIPSLATLRREGLRSVGPTCTKIHFSKWAPIRKATISNKRPPPSLSFLFLCSEDTRKTCFYCHLINKFWGLNYIGISTGRGPPSGWWNPGTGWQFLNKRSLPPPPFFSEFPWGLKWVNKTFKLKKSIHSINLDKCNEMARVHIDFRGKVTF